MFTPTPLYKTYTLCDYTFQIYDITGFDFKEQLDLPHEDGIYCFTSENGGKELKFSEDKTTSHLASVHNLYYLGMTSDFTKRFDQHEKSPKLLAIKPLRIGIYICKSGEDKKHIESLILDTYAIKENIAENEIAKKQHLQTTITED